MKSPRENSLLSVSVVALVIIVGTAALLVTSVYKDSATLDEPEHITSAYSYLRYLDLRFNPWHPPLAKDIAAVPLLFLDLKFPIDSPAWKERRRIEIADQFFYGVGNDPDLILLCSRIPLILFFCGFLLFYYRWNHKNVGPAESLTALILVALSPLFLANARYVTTDVAAAIGCFAALTTFLKFLFQPSWKRVPLIGIIIGLCFLLKFSVLFTVPVSLFLLCLWIAMRPNQNLRAGVLTLQVAGLYFCAVLTIAVVYYLQMWNFPMEIQTAYNGQVSDWSTPTLAAVVLGTQDLPFLRGFSWYLTGLARVLGFITTAPNWPMYLQGQSYYGGRWEYFPLVWFLKESLPLHLLSLLTIIVAARSGFTGMRHGSLRESLSSTRGFTLLAFAVFIVAFWVFALRASVNIGVRHILPTVPFIATLVAQGAWHWARMAPSVRSAQLRRSCIFGLLTWQILAALFTWPAYLGSFNLLAGPRERYSHWSIGADFDWGQDLRRLAEYVHKKKIPRIAIRYFGGGKPEYYLAEKLLPLPPPTVDLPHGEYVAISIHLLELARSKVKDGVPAKDDEWVTWFDRHTPIATVGTTILIYRSGET